MSQDQANLKNEIQQSKSVQNQQTPHQKQDIQNPNNTKQVINQPVDLSNGRFYYIHY